MANEVKDAKMICKSIDALTREIFLLRKDILEGWKLVDEMKELDKGNDIPPTTDTGDEGRPTGCG